MVVIQFKIEELYNLRLFYNLTVYVTLFYDFNEVFSLLSLLIKFRTDIVHL